MNLDPGFRARLPVMLAAAWIALPAAAALAAPADADTTRAGDRQWVGLPFVAYAPETGVQAGGVLGHYRRFGPGARPSSFLSAVTVTARKQYIVEFLPDAYLAGGTRIDGELRYRHYPDVFYGVGPGAPAGAEEDYTARTVIARARAQRPVTGALRLGFEARFRQERMISIEEGGLLDGGEVIGAEGGRLVGFGAAAMLDTRDNVFSPTRGRYVEAVWLIHDGAIGSEFDFQRIVLDGRQFVAVGGGSVLALQAYVHATPGDAPFSALPLLGGPNRLRGYREGRYRDRFYAAAQSELRFPVWRRVGGVAFIAAGDVAPRPGDLDLGSLEVAGGAGVRFRFTSEGVVLRGDVALGREGMGLYFSIGHAF